MRRAWIVVAAALLVAGCTTSEGMKVRETTELTPDQRTVIEQAVRLQLKDPESARFGDFTAGLSSEGVTVCGIVNAKNSLGGYTGGVRFFGVLKGTTFTDVTIDSAGADDIPIARLRCRKVGLIPGWPGILEPLL